MQYTAEQKVIISATGNIKINAVAGSGKTSTLLGYAAARPKSQKGLYLAFNKTVKTEARERFTKAGLARIRVETAHSLAYAHIVRGSSYQVRHQGYRPYDLAQLLDLENCPEAQAAGGGHKTRTFAYILGSHVARVLAAFCNSAVPTVKDLNYPATVEEPRAKAFADTHAELIERKTRKLLKLLNEGRIGITHDFYLKKFQLECPLLDYDYILFDEAQDASGSMLDWFLRQRGTKIIVGDTHQQIYAWRGAVNSLEAVDFPTLPLHTSFRFAQGVADLAGAVLAYKAPGGSQPKDRRVPLVGAGRSREEKTRAVIGRSNLGLLVKAISYITGPHAVERIYFEGNLNAYIYGSEGASLYDVLHLQNGNSERVRDPLLASMANLDELTDYADQTGDKELQLLIELVETYGEELFDIMADLKRRQVPEQQRHTAQLYFSTVHRCKGLEYDLVDLAPDFISTEDVLKFHLRRLTPDPPTPGEEVRFREQVNLLYVAVTRTRYRLWLPQESVPPGYAMPVGEQAELVGYPGLGNTYLTVPAVLRAPVADAGRARAAPARLAREGAPWTMQEEQTLTIGFCQDESIQQLAAKLARTQQEVKSRIEFLDLYDKYGLPSV